jgi:hypothetical protein
MLHEPQNAIFISVSNPSYEVPVKPASTELEKAKKDGNAVILVITGFGATELDKAMATAKATCAKVKKLVIIQMNRDESVNSGIVSKFGIASVPLPFLLAISPKGFPVGGFPYTQATPEKLIEALPSPKEDEVIAALSQKQPLLIIVYKKDYADKKDVLANCRNAGNSMKSVPAIIEIDFDDPNEKEFLIQIGVEAIKGKSMIVVSNASGQVTETFEGVTDVEKLKAAAVKVIKSGCSPGGCGGKKC